MTSVPRSLAAALLVTSVLAGCGSAESPGAPALGTAGADVSAPAPLVRRSTSGTIALGNLDARILLHEAELSGGDATLGSGLALLGLYADRARFRGSFADLTKMRELSASLVARYPSAETHAARARFLSAVHQFQAAAAELETARDLGLESADAALDDLEVSTGGDVQGAVERHRRRAALLPSFQTLTALATAEAAGGEFAAADAHYVQAASLYRDVSPLALGWLAFARGVMWAEMAGLPDHALPLYREAVERLPGYVTANVHLAELEVERGERASAVARLERVAAGTDDPEPAALLAELLLAADPRASAPYAAVARERYDALLVEFRLAFADHGAEFFAGPVGADPERAVDLALDNVAHRPTPRAYIVAIEAARAAGRRELACQLALAAEPRRVQSVNLDVLLDELACH